MREASGSTASRNATQTRLVATRSLAWRLPSTRAAIANEPRTKRMPAIRAHWMELSRPAAALMPRPSTTEPAATAQGNHLGRDAARRVLGPFGVRVALL